MTPKEKAKELVFKFYTSFPLDDFANERYIFVKKHAKNCALIAVDECLHTCVESMIYYWQEVKQEIEKL